MDYNKIIKNVQVYGFEESVRRAKFPMAATTDDLTTDITKGITALAQSPKGAGEDNFLKGIIVQFDLTFTIKAWTEAERYAWFDIVSSQSTMHRITKFNLDRSYIEYVDPRIISIMREKIEAYNDVEDALKNHASGFAESEIKEMIEDNKQRYLEILYSNPCGIKLTAGMTTNYRQLKTIYAQRRTHRLPEWQALCDWIETLPHSEFIIGNIKKSKKETQKNA